MQIKTFANRKLASVVYPATQIFQIGFTLIELMIVIVIVAIGVALAVPSFKLTIQKRQLVATTEEFVSFMDVARGEAIKRNGKVTVSWSSSGGHDVNWCIGASLPPKKAPCDCMETDTTQDDFCSIDSVPYRLVQTDFTNSDYEFLHINPKESSFAFDPVLGTLTDIADPESIDGDWLFYVHSDMKVEGTRFYELQVKVNATGRTSICADDDRISIIGGYPKC